MTSQASGLELHDAEIESIVVTPAEVCIRFSHACVYRQAPDGTVDVWSHEIEVWLHGVTRIVMEGARAVLERGDTVAEGELSPTDPGTWSVRATLPCERFSMRMSGSGGVLRVDATSASVVSVRERSWMGKWME